MTTVGEPLVRTGTPIGFRVPLAGIDGKDLNALVRAAGSAAPRSGTPRRSPRLRRRPAAPAATCPPESAGPPRRPCSAPA
jgi:hypothetical protein